MTELQNDPAVYLERAARILGVPLSSKCLSDVIANHENFHALFLTITGSGKSNPLEFHKP
jgi:hypothetical protein